MEEQDKIEEKVKVDGKEVSQEQLREISSNSNIRLHQESEQSFRTLHRMKG